jgi:fengycin family lipopeptide synthetase B
MNEKVSLVTGAAKGVGRATALKMTERGDKLAMFDLDLIELQETVNEIQKKGGVCKAWRVNVADPDQVFACIKEVLAEFGRIDVLANIAGIIVLRTFMNTSLDDFKKILDVNLYGTFYMMKAVLPQMVKQRSGFIVNVGSVSAHAGYSHHAAYSVSKAGVLRLTEAAADELREYNIHVNAVCPRGIATSFFGPKMAALDQAKWIQPEDVADAIAFLSSDQAKAVTGSYLDINGMYLVSPEEVRPYLELGDDERQN